MAETSCCRTHVSKAFGHVESSRLVPRGAHSFPITIQQKQDQRTTLRNTSHLLIQAQGIQNERLCLPSKRTFCSPTYLVKAHSNGRFESKYLKAKADLKENIRKQLSDLEAKIVECQSGSSSSKRGGSFSFLDCFKNDCFCTKLRTVLGTKDKKSLYKPAGSAGFEETLLPHLLEEQQLTYRAWCIW